MNPLSISLNLVITGLHMVLAILRERQEGIGQEMRRGERDGREKEWQKGSENW